MIRDRITARASRQSQSGEDRDRDRMEEKGAVDINTVDQALLREDLGFKMSDSQYAEYLENETAFNEEYSSVISTNTQAIEQIKSQLASLTDVDSPYSQSTDSAWNTAKSGFSTIRVVNGSNVEAVYKLPADVINQLNSTAFNQGNGSYVGNWVHDGIYNVDVTPQGTSSVYGNELHQLIQSAEQEVQTEFYKQASSQIDAANSEAYANWEAYNQAVSAERAKGQSLIAAAQARIDDANNQKALRDQQKAGYKKQYEDSVSQRQALFK